MHLPNLVYVLDVFGTAAFAFSGMMRCASRRPDIVGLAILATATAVGGGIVRDAILSRRAIMLEDPVYLTVILMTVCISALFPKLLRRGETFFQYADAIGLGIFSAIGATLAVDNGLNPLSVLFIAGITGAGGGIIRDILLSQTPIVLYREIYILPVLAGAGCLQIVRHYGGSTQWAFVVAAVVTIAIRFPAIWFKWSLPRLSLAAGEE